MYIYSLINFMYVPICMPILNLTILYNRFYLFILFIYTYLLYSNFNRRVA